MLIDRRDFLGVGAVALLGLSTRRAPEPVRVALLAPGPDAARTAPWLGAALDGARLGAEEATHTFMLLGREIELAGGDVARATAVVSLLADDAAPRHALVIDARADATCAVDGVFRVGSARADALLWHESLFRYGAQQLNERFRRRFGRAMDEHAWAAWFALKVVAEAALRSRSDDPAALAGWLLEPRARFDGHKGAPLFFDPNRVLVQPTYRVAADGIRELDPEAACAS